MSDNITATVKDEKCSFHTHTDMVTNCARCGKPICKDCADACQVCDDEYEGKPLCYDCYKELVGKNVKLLKKQRSKIIARIIFTLLGMFVGLFIGLLIRNGNEEETPAWIIAITAFIGGCLWTFIVNVGRVFVNTGKNFARGAWLGGIFFFFFDFVKAVVLAVWGTIQKLFLYTKYLIKTGGYIKSDSQCLTTMEEFMQYSIAIDSNVDDQDLMEFIKNNETLANNSYAQMVLADGEQSAANSLKECVNTTKNNGEVIQDFKL